MFNVIAIKQAYPGHARQAGLLAAGCQSASYLGRFVVVVDEDVDPSRPVRRDVGGMHALRSGERHRVRAPRLERAARSAARQGELDQLARHHRRLPAVRAAEGFPMVARASPELTRKVKEKFADILGRIGCA